MSFIDNWLRPDIQTISAYKVLSAEGKIKLDAMESPFSLSDKLTEKYLACLAHAKLNRYPSVTMDKLKKTLREFMDIPSEFDVLLGNGSDELIQLLSLACEAGDTLMSFTPSFVMYEMIATFTRLNYVGVPLTDDFEINSSRILLAMKNHKPKLIFIAYPNNPTGNIFDRKAIEILITKTDAMVVIDEAYYAYANDTFLADVKKYSNLVLLRTVSKIGFAGLRLGLLIGMKSTIEQLNKLRLPYNISTLTQESANFLLKHKAEITSNISLIIIQRQILITALKKISHLNVYPSQANFILFKADNADGLFEYLKDNSVLIKNLSLQGYLRVTVGNVDENQQFIQMVRNFYG